MKEAYKSHIKKCILRMQENSKKCSLFYDNGIDLINYESGLGNCIEEGIALMCATNEKQFEWALEMLQWWLFNGVDKKIWDSKTNEVLNDLNNIDDLIDYLTQYI